MEKAFQSCQKFLACTFETGETFVPLENACSVHEFKLCVSMVPCNRG